MERQGGFPPARFTPQTPMRLPIREHYLAGTRSTPPLGLGEEPSARPFGCCRALFPQPSPERYFGVGSTPHPLGRKKEFGD
jgi:hypothetical protein